MISRRKRNSPGIELNEIDHSQYNQTQDYSFPNAPICLVTGFADKGEDYKTQWINSRGTFIEKYGYPTNTAEQYFFNAAMEILNRNAVLLTNKLPYYNNSKDCFTYVEYSCEFKKITTEDSDFSEIKTADESLTSYIDINLEQKIPQPLLNLQTFDTLLTNKNGKKNTIKIVNISRNKYEESEIFDKNNKFLGIVPVIVTAANALYYQNLLEHNTDSEKYNLITNFSTRLIEENKYRPEHFSINLSSDTNIDDETTYDNSLSKQLVSYFPNISYTSNTKFDVTNLKKIGIIVLKAYNDTANDDKINFEVLESFIGSIDKNARNNVTNAIEYIDTIVNSQSQYINVFTNIDANNLQNACFTAIKNQTIKSLGFTDEESEKKINYSESIVKPLNKMFGVLNNTTTSNIDIIIDAGMSNIAQYLTGEEENKTYNGDENFDTGVNNWFNIVKMFDDFCKYTRKDCIFIADAPRPFCLNGESKIVRSTCPSNTIEKSILPNLKYLTGINSSYSTGYCDWFYCRDEYTDDFFWCPPSIKAAGAYCYTDIYFHKWDAPAGMYRGIVRNAYDVAFSPTDDEAGRIYQQTWNYAVNYPINGIILEGQKTFQRNQTALDRINVRRLLLHLEKQTARIARMFLYEGNTAYNRQRLVDMLTPIFEDAKNGNGLIEYLIKCDEENNTTTTIDRNELHVSIAVKPVKSIEYIILNFGITNQSTSISEEIRKI